MAHIRGTRAQTYFNLFTGLVTTIVTFVIGFFLSPFIVKHLGAEANGFSQLAANFVTYASLVTMAFNSMGARFVSVSYHQREIDKCIRHYSTICVVNVAMILIFIPIAIFVVYDLEKLIVIENAEVVDIKLLFACVFLNFFLSLINSLFSIAMFVTNRIFYSNVLTAIRTIINALLLLVVFNALPIKVFYVSAVSAFLTMVLIPVYAHYHRRLLPEIHYVKGCFSWKSVKELFFSGIWNTINQCGHLLNTGFDLLMANLFVSPLMMGVLAVSKTIPSAIIKLTNTVSYNFSPSLVQAWAKNDKEQILKELRSSIKISSVIISVPIITFCCFGYEFYSLWQPTLDAKTLTVLSFLTVLPFIPVAGTQTLYNVYTASNKLKVNSITFLMAGIVNVIVVYICIKKFPDYGVFFIAGVSAIISIIRNLVITLPYVAKVLRLPWYTFFKDLLQTLMCCSINALFAIPFLIYLRPNGWGGLIIVCVITAGLAFIADIFILLNKSERRQIIQKMFNWANKSLRSFH